MRRSLTKKSSIVFVVLLLINPMLILTVNINPSVSNGTDISDMINTSGTITTLDPSLIPEYDYTDLNETWYDHNIEMVIISPNITEFINALIPLRNGKIKKELKQRFCIIFHLTLEEINLNKFVISSRFL